jgi:hypothetical protein
MAVLQNYLLVGTLWVKNPESPLAPWRADGSTTLLNTTMESCDQLGGPNAAAPNCFTCRTFNGTENTTSISHILPIATAQQPAGNERQTRAAAEKLTSHKSAAGEIPRRYEG